MNSLIDKMMKRTYKCATCHSYFEAFVSTDGFRKEIEIDPSLNVALTLMQKNVTEEECRRCQSNRILAEFAARIKNDSQRKENSH